LPLEFLKRRLVQIKHSIAEIHRHDIQLGDGPSTRRNFDVAPGTTETLALFKFVKNSLSHAHSYLKKTGLLIRISKSDLS
jgi:hypothetical protein